MKTFGGARRPFSSRQTASRPARRSLIVQAVNTEQLRGAKADLAEMIKSRSCNPIIVRLAWHDSGNYNKDQEGEWPQAGGATGSIRFKPEIDYDANKGLSVALQLLKPINKKYPDVSFADLFQMASAVAIEVAGGPVMPIRYGRMDAQAPEDCPPDGRHPGGGPTYDDGSPSAGDHLRRVFYRMGLNDRDIVALSGAHTLGRAFADRSGYGRGREGTKYTSDGPGVKGGTSWTPNWLVFDNSYFQHAKDKTDDELLRLDTDACLFLDEGFKPFAEKYLADQDAFFADYTEAHLKLSELGAKWEEDAPVTL